MVHQENSSITGSTFASQKQMKAYVNENLSRFKSKPKPDKNFGKFNKIKIDLLHKESRLAAKAKMSQANF